MIKFKWISVKSGFNSFSFFYERHSSSIYEYFYSFFIEKVIQIFVVKTRGISITEDRYIIWPLKAPGPMEAQLSSLGRHDSVQSKAAWVCDRGGHWLNTSTVRGGVLPDPFLRKLCLHGVRFASRKFFPAPTSQVLAGPTNRSRI